MRTQREIIARLETEKSGGTDFFGTRTTDLLVLLDYEYAKEYLNDGVTAEEWSSHQQDEKGLVDEVGKYLPFALDKAANHRGLSANRSVEHFAIWIWAYGTDSDVAAFHATDYGNYGVPKVLKAAEIFGVRDQIDSLLTDELRRMAAGLPCNPNCDEGCDS